MSHNLHRSDVDRLVATYRQGLPAKSQRVLDLRLAADWTYGFQLAEKLMDIFGPSQTSTEPRQAVASRPQSKPRAKKPPPMTRRVVRVPTSAERLRQEEAERAAFVEISRILAAERAEEEREREIDETAQFVLNAR